MPGGHDYQGPPEALMRYQAVVDELLSTPGEFVPWLEQAWEWIGSPPPKPTKR